MMYQDESQYACGLNKAQWLPAIRTGSTQCSSSGTISSTSLMQQDDPYIRKLQSAYCSLRRNEHFGSSADSLGSLDLGLVHVAFAILEQKLENHCHLLRILGEVIRADPAAERRHDDVVFTSFVRRRLQPEGVPPLDVLLAHVLRPLRRAPQIIRHRLVQHLRGEPGGENRLELGILRDGPQQRVGSDTGVVLRGHAEAVLVLLLRKALENVHDLVAGSVEAPEVEIPTGTPLAFAPELVIVHHELHMSFPKLVEVGVGDDLL
mmetsp:Transcript_1046/g.2038  ORF Transcript_1046/g.2038 Transcript_1046/m.2038 type:complete len:263 (-) Transcript_1046:581-1369(-)